ncbi:MAG TPA: hypothetical protein VMP01_07885 [Pirellulaceae bacterium]|nr:hypothetical protein [Pirellulaceae bacterium]
MGRCYPSWWAGICLVAALVAPHHAAAVEPAKAFLDALRQQKYFDVALEYLDTLPDNPAVPVEFKQTLKYERGVTLVEGARFQRDSALKDKWLDEAQQVLTEYVSGQKADLLAVSARSQLGNVIVERAKSRLEKSKKQSGDAKNQLLLESRTLFEEAIKIFEGQIDTTRERLKQYPNTLSERDGKPFEERTIFRTEFLAAKVLAVAAKEEMAETYAPDSAEYKKLIGECVEGYKLIHDDYRTLLAGMYARAYQARALQKLGQHKDALGYFTELLAQPDNSDLHELRVLTVSLAIDSWSALKLYKQIVEIAYPLVDKARPNEDRSDEFMGMRVKIARAYKAYADLLKAENPRDPQVKRLLNDGRALASKVARFRGPYQEQARRLLAEFAGADIESIAGDKPNPKTFTDALTAGRDAVQKMNDSEQLIKQLNLRLPTIADVAQRSEIENQVKKAEEVAAEARDMASQYLRLALSLADKETGEDDLNVARYFVCYLSFLEQKYYESVVLGRFVAERYPTSQGARQCAKIAMAAWLKLYNQRPGGENDFESQQIIHIADYIVQKWPDQPEAADALNTLIEFMIRERRLKEAQEYLAKIPVDSPHRGTAELKLGQALWASYLASAKELRLWEQDASQVPAGADIAARKQELETLKTHAQTTLQDGVARMQESGEMNPIGATAVLSLANVLVDTNQPAKAIAMLEDERLGSLTLLAQNHPATQKEGFDTETYKTALRAYISALGSTKNPQPLIAKAKQMMDALKASMGEAGQARLVATYVTIARDLQTQMELADDSAKKGLATGFEVFLKEVGAEAKEKDILYWVADTYRAMGESFLTGGAGGRAAAKPYLTSAITAYQKILAQVADDPSSTALATQIRLQMARTYRSMGQFVDAVDQYQEILRPAKSRWLLPVQIEAAETYQEWGAYLGDHKDRYGNAIFGARRDEKNPDTTKQRDNIIWGWGEIAIKTANQPQFAEQFHQARYNLALCRYKWALAEKDAAAKAQRLKQAKADVVFIVRLYRDLGGPQQEAQYDQLLRDIQKSLGEPAGGIPALRQTKPSATPAVKPKLTPTSTN